MSEAEERMAFSSARIAEVKATIRQQKQIDFPSKNRLCVYVTGSYGRYEATQFSDLDLFFVGRGNEAKEKDKITNVDHSLINASVIKSCRGLNFPEFSGGGEYLTIHYISDMLDDLGGSDDDYKNYFTARMLLLLESKCVHNSRVYDKCINLIIERYFVDYHDHETT